MSTTETKNYAALAASLRRDRRHRLPEGQCPECDRERAAGVWFHPPHDASDTCRSGKHPHCTCDSCF